MTQSFGLQIVAEAEITHADTESDDTTQED